MSVILQLTNENHATCLNQSENLFSFCLTVFNQSQTKSKPIVTWRTRVFLRLAQFKHNFTFTGAWPLSSFMFCRIWHQLLVFPRLAPVYVFPRLASVLCFPALGTSFIFSRVWPPSFMNPALVNICMFFRGWHQFCFRRLAP